MISLPIEKKWFRYLFLYSFAIGIVGGSTALLYTYATSIPSEWLFGGPADGLWTGKWWWIVVTAIGGGLVMFLRSRWGIPDKLPGAVEVGQEAIIEPKDVPRLVLISIISLVFGASLGPSYGIVMLGGGFGSFIFGRMKRALKIQDPTKEIEREYTRAGMASSLGSVFSDPLLGTLFTNELSPSKKNQLASSIPQLIAAIFGFLIFYGLTGATIQKVYQLPAYEFEYRHLFVGVILGLSSVVVLLIFSFIGRVVSWVMNAVSNRYIRGITGGALVGLFSYMVPLTFGSGNGQLSFATNEFANLGTSFLFIAFIVKMVSVSVSQQSGFLGGNVFPTLFIGGISGMFIHGLFPEIPLALCVSSMMAAVPGATLSTPLSIVLIATIGVGLGTSQVPPVIMAVVVAQMSLASLRYIKISRTAV